LTQKYIHLRILSEYKVELQNFIESDTFNKDVTYYNDFVELNIYMDKSKEETTKIRIASEIANIIINIVKRELLKENIKKICRKINVEDIEKVYKNSLKFFQKKEAFMKDNIFNRVYDYISTNNHINIYGFIKFRMKCWPNEINKISSRSIEEYLSKKNKDEFINALRYFVEVQEEKIDLLKVKILENGSFILYDKDDNIIENENAEDMINTGLKENLNYEDFLISTLLTWCPKEMLIYDNLENDSSKNIIETVKSIFDYRVIIKQRA
jgi:putative sporulation protein YtxC